MDLVGGILHEIAGGVVDRLQIRFVSTVMRETVERQVQAVPQIPNAGNAFEQLSGLSASLLGGRLDDEEFGGLSSMYACSTGECSIDKEIICVRSGVLTWRGALLSSNPKARGGVRANRLRHIAIEQFGKRKLRTASAE